MSNKYSMSKYVSKEHMMEDMLENGDAHVCVVCEEIYPATRGVKCSEYYLCSHECKEAKEDDDRGQANW